MARLHHPPPDTRHTTVERRAARQFDAWSRSYDRSLLQRLFFGPAHAAILDRVLKLPPEAAVLDVGCGTGQFARKLLLGVPDLHLTGLDLSDAMLDHARRRNEEFGPRARFVQGSSDRLPFADGHFDAVTCCHSFHHYPDQPRALAEMFRVLKPGGRLLLVDGDRDGWWGWALYDGLVTFVEKAVHHCSARRLGALADAAGFRSIKHRRRGLLLPYFLFQATAVKEAAVLPRAA